MPSTPFIKFNLINNNEWQSEPLTGVSNVVARTTKGPFLAPDKVIRSLTQFRNMYGQEIVPDGSVSNIETALRLGSILRISAPMGANAEKGELIQGNLTSSDSTHGFFIESLSDEWISSSSPSTDQSPSTSVEISVTLVDSLPSAITSAGIYLSGAFGGVDDISVTIGTQTMSLVAVPNQEGNYSASYPLSASGVMNIIIPSYKPDENWQLRFFVAGNQGQTFISEYSIRTLETGTSSITPSEEEGANEISFEFAGSVAGNVALQLNTKNYGETFGNSDTGYGRVGLKNSNLQYFLYGTDIDNWSSANLLASGNITKIINPASSPDGTFYMDSSSLVSFVANNPYFDVTLKSSEIPGVENLDEFYDFINSKVGQTDIVCTPMVGTTAIMDESETYFVVTSGSRGDEPTVEDWIEAADALGDYTDAYQMFCSHIDQHLTRSEDIQLIHQHCKDLSTNSEEFVYFINVPKLNGAGEPMNYLEIADWTSDMIGKIGYSKFVAYFAGGLKYYDTKGILRNCDSVGTAIGLGNASETTAGPWYSFAGLNRGVVGDANGIVSPNYGTPTKAEQLEEIAQAYTNIFVIKDTRNNGKRVVLWHNFTSALENNSYQLHSVVRLNLYLKKTLRPILESYIEEQNTFSTWDKIYLEVAPILERLVNENAMTNPVWEGDQFKSSYADLSVNTEAGVRAGKYYARLTFQDVVTLQFITVDFVIDAVSQTTEVNL